MELRTGYKQTEVGVIPEDWEITRLTSVAKLESGHTPSKRKPAYWAGNIPWVSLHDSQNLEKKEISNTERTISLEGLNNSSARMLPRGTVVFSRTATVGKSTALGRDMATSQDFANYICGPRLHNHFLVYLFRSMAPEWKKLMAGSIHNTIYMPVFKRLQIGLPPVGEQEDIAGALSDADALIESLEQLIAKKRQIKQGAMQELLTGKKRLPGFSGEWKKIFLSQIADIRSGGTPSTFESLYWNGPIPWCTPTDITALKGHKYLTITADQISDLGLKNSSAEVIPPYSVIMTSRATIGECALNQVPMTTNQGFKNFVPKIGTHVEFLYYLLLTKKQDFIGLCGGSTFLEIGKAQLSIFEVKIPTLEEQTAIATILSDMDADLAALEAKLSKARQLKQGMMQELLTGKIRLAKPASNIVPFLATKKSAQSRMDRQSEP